MRHINPATIASPQNQVDNVHVIYDGGVNPNHPYSIARIDWDGVQRIAIRWNVSENEWTNQEKIKNIIPVKGMPISHSHPVWFVLPSDFLNID